MAIVCYNDIVMNLLRPDCNQATGRLMGVLFQRQKNNGFDLTQAIAANTIQDLILNSDKNLRIFPLMRAKNKSTTQAEPIFETATNGAKEKLRDGILAVNLEFWGNQSSHHMNKLIESHNFEGNGVYLVMEKGIYAMRNGNKAIPIPFNGLSSMFAPSTDTTTQKNMVTFDVDPDFKASYFHFLDFDTIGITLPDLQNSGLKSCQLSKVGTTSATELSVQITTGFAWGTQKNTVSGLVLADFDVKNGNTAVAGLAVQELPSNGGYKLTFTGQTVGNVITVQLKISSGYEADTPLSITL